MYQAILNNKIISSTEFNNKYPNYKELGIYATCPKCLENLHLYGCKSLLKSINCKFSHYPGSKCNWSEHRLIPSGRFNKDIQIGINLKNQFTTIYNLKKAFKIMQNIVGYIFNVEIFINIYSETNRVNMWNYKNMSIDKLPYFMIMNWIFLSNKNYGFHYTLSNDKSQLEKRFIKSGKLMTSGYNNLINISDDILLNSNKNEFYVDKDTYKKLIQLL
jgi:hypothetical protein